MFIINKKEYKEIIDVIVKNCCCYCSPYICSESDCDIQEIIALLSKHTEDDYIYDEELPFQ